MTELEMMQRAKMYMDKLAQGIDPLTDRELPDDTLLNNVRLARCFFFTSEILRRVIENGGEVQQVRKGKKSAFALTPEQREKLELSSAPLKISEFVERLNAVINQETTKKISTTAITNWLLGKGFLEEVESVNGKKSRLPTEQGIAIGMSTVERMTVYGAVKVVMYNLDAQNFILDHLETIMEGTSSMIG